MEKKVAASRRSPGVNKCCKKMNDVVQQVASRSGTAMKMGMVGVGREVNKTAPVVTPVRSYSSSHV